MENNYNLKELLSNKTLEQLTKIGLIKASEEMLNRTFMINIDGNDFKTAIDNKDIVCFTHQLINNAGELKLYGTGVSCTINDDFNGIVLIYGGNDVPLMICDEIITTLNKKIGKEVNIIFGFGTNPNKKETEVLAIITKN